MRAKNVALLTQIREKRMPCAGNCYLRLEGLRPGAPDLTLGCVTEGGSLAGKLSASSRSSSRSSGVCSLPKFSCFSFFSVLGFLSDLAFAFAIMVRSFEAGGRQGTNPTGDRSVALGAFFLQIFGTIRPRCSGWGSRFRLRKDLLALSLSNS
jgi:hypothetical protein